MAQQKLARHAHSARDRGTQKLVNKSSGATLAPEQAWPRRLTPELARHAHAHMGGVSGNLNCGETQPLSQGPDMTC